ncbi:MAG TPA: DoxX family protein [Pseudolabrys sp.]|nr:DoxX family protein [Pseudolabrys sp.]
MNLQVQNSSHPLLSCADGVVVRLTDLILVLGRIALAAVFIVTASYGNPTAATLAGHGWPAPEVWSVIARMCEFAFGFGLILGLATRYAALLGIIYVLIASFSAHLWWTYPAGQQGNMYAHFMKNTAIIGGLLAILVIGAGRWSIDAMLSRKS